MSDISSVRDIVVIAAVYLVYQKLRDPVGSALKSATDYAGFISQGGELTKYYADHSKDETKTELITDAQNYANNLMRDVFGPNAPSFPVYNQTPEYSILPVIPSQVNQGSVSIGTGGSLNMPSDFFAWSPRINPDGSIQIW